MLSALRGIGLCAIIADPSELVDESAETLAQYRALAAGASADIPRQLLENLAPSGRMLREALNKQVLLETIFLKAMREAHAVKLDTILRKLNQLRSAGELKFVEAIPRIEPAAPVATPPPVPAPKVEVPAPKAEVKPEMKVELPAPKPEVKPEVKVEPPAPKPEVKAEVKVEPPAPKAEVKPEMKVEPPAPKPEVKPEVKVEPPAPKAEVKAEVKVEPPAPKPESSAEAKNEPSSSPDGKRRVSIANAHPEAIRDAVRNDPEIREAAELFDGMVIDIHRPVRQ